MGILGIEITGQFCVEVMATALAVLGCVLNNRKRRACFAVWIVSNIVCGILHAKSGLFGLVVRDVLFSVLAIEGWFCWRNLTAKDTKSTKDPQRVVL